MRNETATRGGFWKLYILILIAIIAALFALWKTHDGAATKTVAVSQVQSIVVPQKIAPSPAPATPALHEYLIKRGDTLTKISQTSSMSIDAILKQNPQIINRDIIFAGLTLTLVNSTSTPEKSATVSPKVFPEKFAVTQGASQEKPSLTAPHSPLAHSDTATLKTVRALRPCHMVGNLAKDFVQGTLARATCITAQYGSFIKEAIAVEASHGRVVNPTTVVAMILTESGGNPLAVSAEPCRGLMQLKDSTAAAYGVKLESIYDPRENISGGIRILSDYVHRYRKGDEDYGIASYNCGPHCRSFRKPGFAPEQMDYVRKVKHFKQTLETHKFEF